MHKTWTILLLILFTGSLSALAKFKPYLLAVMEGERDGDWLGRSMSGAGDINGDGYDDIGIVGAGKIYVYFGSPDFDPKADLILTREDGFNRVAMGGDVNGDGFDDLLAATPKTPFLSKAYLYLGSSQPDTVPDFTFDCPYYAFGFSLSISGDYNNDGFDDILISSNDAGRVYLYLGGAEMDTIADAVFYEGGNLFGQNICPGADFNCDGYDDILITSSINSFLYIGNQNIKTKPDFIFKPGALASGDFNGDHYFDMYIAWEGILYGSSTIDVNVDLAFEKYGIIVSGYFNRDSFSDLLAGSYSDYGGLGAAYVYLGGDPMDNRFDWGSRGTGGGQFGQSVANAGDVNGDGVEDFLIGEPGYYFGSNRGRVFLLSGDTSLVSGIDDGRQVLSDELKLEANYPNPFNRQTLIRYQVPTGNRQVAVNIMNPLGQTVRTLVDQIHPAGRHQVVWDGRDNSGKEVSTGVYLIVISAGTLRQSRKILLLK